VKGRASPEGNSRQPAVVRTLSITTGIRLAVVRRSAGGFKPRAADVQPKGGAWIESQRRRFRAKTAGLPRTTEAERLVIKRIGQNVFRDTLMDYWGGPPAF
jgi:hypothetical protein